MTYNPEKESVKAKFALVFLVVYLLACIAYLVWLHQHGL